ncbi:MAG: hypothetical protein KGS61_10685 [Verrucomicrobia bacterium]|nr:hypothetical protein [Verrucomicrobiota bacterium]
MKFEPVSVENLPPGKPNPAWHLAKTVRYWPAKDHPGATIDLYMEDSWNVHAFLQSKAGYLNLGEVGLASPDVKVTATNWERDGVQLGRNIITIEGSIGADCAVLVILGFDPLDRQWKLLAHIEGTDIERTNLEPRGPDVIVSMFGRVDATLYRWKGSQFEEVDLGKAVTRNFGRPFYVDGGSIVDARTFRCGPIVKGGLSKPTKFYGYNDAALIEVKPKNKSKAR